MRGTFDFLTTHKTYAESSKVWYVSLQQCDCFWYDLIVNSPFGRDAPTWAKLYLTNLKEQVETSLEKRFIYMYGSRTKVRFDTKRPITKRLFSRERKLNLLVGREQRRVSVPWDPSSAPMLEDLPAWADPKFITFGTSERKYTFSVHDFLRIFGIGLGESTSVHYVGITKNPHSRPLSREHRGYGDMVYGIGTDSRDFFLFVSLYKVMTIGANDGLGVHFLTAHAMTDEVGVQKEGELIEKAFIAYFDSRFQEEGGAGERAKLEAQLKRARAEHSIGAVILDFELDRPCPYFRLSSAARSPSDRHVFRVALGADGLEIDPLAVTFDINRDVILRGQES